MAKKQDILELKRRFKKDDCTFTRLTGCYVDGEKNKTLSFGETFLNMDDEEFYKYLEIAKRALSGKIGDNLLNLSFIPDANGHNDIHDSLMALNASGLNNDDMLENFYDHVIENYDYPGQYLILLFHDAYDIIKKTSDNGKLDESEEVYEYILCAVCPVVLSKPGLGYREEENRIGARIRDWVVSAPESGFLYPSFHDRSADFDQIVCYTKNKKQSHKEFMEGALGCNVRRTATEKQEMFAEIVYNAVNDEEDARNTYLDFQESLCNKIDELSDSNEVLSSEHIKEILKDADVPEETAEQVAKGFKEEFKNDAPTASVLYDEKAVANDQLRIENKSLKKQIGRLQSGSDDESPVQSNAVVLRIPEEKRDMLSTEIVNGEKCIVIPVAEGERTIINGILATI